MIGRVATGFLIAVIIGIILLGIVIFILYDVFKGGSWDCAKCKTEFTTWCTNCFLANIKTTTTPTSGSEWQDGGELGKELYECVRKCNYWPSATSVNQDCVNAEDACKPFILYTR